MNVSSSLVLIPICFIYIATGIPAEKDVARSRERHESSARLYLRSKGSPSTQRVTGYKKCKTQYDCSKDECCAFRNRRDGKVCKKMLLSKQRCLPFEIPGLSKMCPCTEGFTCALTAMAHQRTKPVYRCTAIPADDKFDTEIEEL